MSAQLAEDYTPVEFPSNVEGVQGGDSFRAIDQGHIDVTERLVENTLNELLERREQIVDALKGQEAIAKDIVKGRLPEGKTGAPLKGMSTWIPGRNLKGLEGSLDRFANHSGKIESKTASEINAELTSAQVKRAAKNAGRYVSYNANSVRSELTDAKVVNFAKRLGQPFGLSALSAEEINTMEERATNGVKYDFISKAQTVEKVGHAIVDQQIENAVSEVMGLSSHKKAGARANRFNTTLAAAAEIYEAANNNLDLLEETNAKISAILNPEIVKGISTGSQMLAPPSFDAKLLDVLKEASELNGRLDELTYTADRAKTDVLKDKKLKWFDSASTTALFAVADKKAGIKISEADLAEFERISSTTSDMMAGTGIARHREELVARAEQPVEAALNEEPSAEEASLESQEGDATHDDPEASTDESPKSLKEAVNERAEQLKTENGVEHDEVARAMAINDIKKEHAEAGTGEATADAPQEPIVSDETHQAVAEQMDQLQEAVEGAGEAPQMADLEQAHTAHPNGKKDVAGPEGVSDRGMAVLNAFEGNAADADQTDSPEEQGPVIEGTATEVVPVDADGSSVERTDSENFILANVQQLLRDNGFNDVEMGAEDEAAILVQAEKIRAADMKGETGQPVDYALAQNIAAHIIAVQHAIANQVAAASEASKPTEDALEADNT